MASRRSAGRLALTAAIGSAVATFGCATPTVDGVAPDYDPTSLSGGVVYHWPLGRALTFYIAPPAADLNEALRDAIAVWRPALGYREVTMRLTADAAGADIIIRNAATALPVDTAGCGTPGWAESVGRTLFCPAGDTARTLPLLSGPAGRTKMLITIDVAGTADPSELLAVTVHEIGHALGIGGHSGTPADAMFAFPSAGAPSRADARTLRYVLHRRPDLTL